MITIKMGGDSQIGAKDGNFFFVHPVPRPSAELYIWVESSLNPMEIGMSETGKEGLTSHLDIFSAIIRGCSNAGLFSICPVLEWIGRHLTNATSLPHRGIP